MQILKENAMLMWTWRNWKMLNSNLDSKEMAKELNNTLQHDTLMRLNTYYALLLLSTMFPVLSKSLEMVSRLRH